MSIKQGCTALTEVKPTNLLTNTKQNFAAFGNLTKKARSMGDLRLTILQH